MMKTNDRLHIKWFGGTNWKVLTSLTIRIGLLCFALILTLAAFERAALAYTDPGTGALIWQMVAAGFVGASFYFHRFLKWFKERKMKSSQTAGEQQEQ